jgi:hypothetical protein
MTAPKVTFSEPGDQDRWSVTALPFEDLNPLCPCGVSVKYHDGIDCEWRPAAVRPRKSTGP